MPPIVAVVIPVIDRPKNAAPFMASLRATEPPERAVAYALCEHDDPASQEAWKAAGAVVVADHDGRSYAEKINIAVGRTTEPWMLPIGDDVKFYPGWLDAALAHQPAKVIGTNDLQMGHVGRSPHALINREYIMTVGAGWEGPGIITYPYAHWYVDDEIATAAQQREVWAYAPDSVIEHLHVTNKKAPDDPVYVRGRTTGAAQYPIFIERAKKNLAYLPVVELGGTSARHPDAAVIVDTRNPLNAPAQHVTDVPWRTDAGKIVDCTVLNIYASHIMQRIPRGDDLLAVMNEAWRILQPGGVFTMIMPLVGFTRGDGVGELVPRWEPYADPTHVSAWWLPEALSMYFCGDDYRAKVYGAHKWSELGPYVEVDQLPNAMTAMPSFWCVRGNWEGIARLEKPKDTPLTRSWK